MWKLLLKCSSLHAFYAGIHSVRGSKSKGQIQSNATVLEWEMGTGQSCSETRPGKSITILDMHTKTET